ncbi:uncharacterized protein BJX67DRAFT_85390 [Aspergillus lucknowensis]|uniref:Uncharacterized protein n=1 Tax=Aspergillus lucknowensis TaxID=176173 RepID=A0ABR4LTG4_9EURO
MFNVPETLPVRQRSSTAATCISTAEFPSNTNATPHFPRERSSRVSQTDHCLPSHCCRPWSQRDATTPSFAVLSCWRISARRIFPDSEEKKSADGMVGRHWTKRKKLRILRNRRGIGKNGVATPELCAPGIALHCRHRHRHNIRSGELRIMDNVCFSASVLHNNGILYTVLAQLSRDPRFSTGLLRLGSGFASLSPEGPFRPVSDDRKGNPRSKGRRSKVASWVAMGARSSRCAID